MNTTTQTLSSKITGNDYISAYSSRRQVVNDYLLQLAKELTEMGYSVYFPKDCRVNFLVINGNGLQCSTGFAEVPYRWYINYNIDKRQKRGSSRTLKEVFNFDTPFTAAEIVSSLQPQVPNPVNPKSYLQLFTI